MKIQLSQRAKRRRPSPIRELAPLLSVEGMLSLGGGYPNPETFAFEKVEVTLAGGGSFSLDGPEVVAAQQYTTTQGFPPLTKSLRKWHQFKDQVDLSGALDLLVLTGSQEGLYLVGDVLIEEGDWIVVSEPTYPGTLAAWRAFAPNYLSIGIDADGLDTKELEATLLRRREEGATLPKVVYTIPNGHNPGGVSLSEDRRKHLIELANEYELLIVEDDPYQLVSLVEAPPLTSLQSRAPERVIRLDSFSKILSPGLRLGYVSGPSEVIRAMVLQKQASSLHSSTYAQATLAGVLEHLGPEGLAVRVEQSVAVYRRNLAAILEAIKLHLPEGVRFNIPRSGMFIWFDLPEGCDADRMVKTDAEALGVLLVPGPAFSPGGGCRHSVRASFSLLAQDQIGEAVRRFGEMIRREMARSTDKG